MAEEQENVNPILVKYEQMITDLLQKVSFTELDTNEKRISHIFKNSQIRDQMKNEFQKRIDEYSVKTDKNFEKAREYRHKGLDFLNQNNFVRSLTNLSLAIRYAPHVEHPDLDDELYMAYRQRAIVYYTNEGYESSLYDIDQSLDLCQTLPDYCHRIDCLRNLRRYTEVLEMITELLGMNDFFKSDIEIRTLQRLQAMIPEIENERQANEQQEIAVENDYYLFVDESVKIEESDDRGRYMISKSDRPKDSLILSEKAQYAQLHEDYLLDICNNCLKTIGQKFFPCVWCTECVFCDVNCYMEAMVRFHRYECGVTGVFYEVRFNCHFAFRILLTTGYTRAQELVQYLDNCLNSGNRFEVRQWIEKYNNQIIPRDQKSIEHKREEFEAFLAFMDHNDSQSLTNQVYSIFEALEMVTLIDISHALVIEDDQAFMSLTKALITIARKIQYNSFVGAVPDSETGEDITIAIVICLVSAMCNHSCVPNIDWKVTDDIQEFVSTRPQ